MEFVELNIEEYQEFVDSYEYASYWQTTYTIPLHESQGRKVYLVGAKDGGVVVAATLLAFSPLHFGKFRVDAARGFCIDYNNKELLEFFSKEVCKFAKKRGGMFLNISPYVPYIERDMDGNEVENGFRNDYVYDNLVSLGYQHFGYSVGYEEEIDSRWNYCLDLEGKDKETLFKETTRKNVRTDINSIEKRGLKVRELQADEMHLFYKMMVETGERHDFGTRTEEFYQTFYETMKPILKTCIVEMHVKDYYNNTKERYDSLINELATVEERIEKAPENTRHQKKKKVLEDEISVEEKNLQTINDLLVEHGEVIPLCVAMFITYGKEYLYLFGASRGEFMKYGGTTAMQWTMINEALDAGCRRYNFYGISGLFNKEDDGYGVYYFKRGFGGYVEELHGQFTMILTPFYSVYKVMQKIIGH